MDGDIYGFNKIKFEAERFDHSWRLKHEKLLLRYTIGVECYYYLCIIFTFNSF